ncbi:MAG: heme exporter protein CcmD [Hydrogenophilaceae bacterium]|nr:heme exporter protein CcmD [Hydrogenophilaceae bacterium]
MKWAGFSQFWAMGGYGLYVWGSFFVTFAVIILEVYLLKKGRVQTLKLLKRMRNFENEA